MTWHDWWNRDKPASRTDAFKDAEIIEKLRSDLYKSHEMCALWRRAYEEMEILIHEFVDDTTAIQKPPPRG